MSSIYGLKSETFWFLRNLYSLMLHQLNYPHNSMNLHIQNVVL